MVTPTSTGRTTRGVLSLFVLGGGLTVTTVALHPRASDASHAAEPRIQLERPAGTADESPEAPAVTDAVLRPGQMLE